MIINWYSETMQHSRYFSFLLCSHECPVCRHQENGETLAKLLTDFRQIIGAMFEYIDYFFNHHSSTIDYLVS